jgi:polysaccharide biosynthesis protein PslA
MALQVVPLIEEPSPSRGQHKPAPQGFQPVAAFCQFTTALDFICVVLAGALWSEAAKVTAIFTPLEATLIATGLAVLCWIAMLRLAPTNLGRLLDMPWAIADALLVPAFVGGGVALLTYLLTDRLHGAALLLWPMAAVSLLMPCRIFMAGLARRGVRDGWLRRRIAVVGATEMSAELINRLGSRDNPEIVDLVGVFDDRDATRRPPEVGGVMVRGGIEALCERARHERLDLIVIALPLSRAMDILRSVQQVQSLTAEVVVLLDGENRAPQGTRRSVIAGYPVLQLVRQPLQPGAIIAKALLDYVTALLTLLAVTPLLLGAALAIRLDSSGPVLFRQPRVGRNGQMFQILKLRTLRWNPEDDGTHGVLADDARITRVGRVLRLLCLDELPQLINVLRGEMSMVGPRPHVANMQVAGRPLAELVPGYGARLRMKPGITGWAQVNGLSGTMLDAGMARAVIAHDLAYLSEWSIWLDLRILARTLVISIFGRNAFDAQLREWRGL